MLYGDKVSDKPCHHCQQAIGTRNLHYDPEGRLWAHKVCHDLALVRFHEASEKAQVALEATRAEARAIEQAGRFGFAPPALEDLTMKEGFAGIFSSKRNRLGNPEFRRTGTG